MSLSRPTQRCADTPSIHKSAQMAKSANGKTPGKHGKFTVMGPSWGGWIFAGSPKILKIFLLGFCIRIERENKKMIKNIKNNNQ